MLQLLDIEIFQIKIKSWEKKNDDDDDPRATQVLIK